MTAKHPASRIIAVALVLGLAGLVAGAVAQPRWIDATASTDLGPILSDPIRDRLYLADVATQEIVIIDTVTETVLSRLGLPFAPEDLALTKNGSILGVVGGGQVTRIDLNTLATRSTAVPAEVTGETVSIAFDTYRRIYLGTGTTFGRIWVLSQNGTAVLNDFGVGPNLTTPPYYPLLETDPTGTVLFVGERGLSPLSIYKIDITKHKKPKYLADDDHGSLGSNLRDMALSPRFDELYVASGFPYGIQVVDATTMDFLALLDTGPYPGAVAMSPLGKRVYGMPKSSINNFLFEFDAATRTELASHALAVQETNGEGQIRGLALDRFGEKAFVVHGRDFSGPALKVQVLDLP